MRSWWCAVLWRPETGSAKRLDGTESLRQRDVNPRSSAITDLSTLDEECAEQDSWPVRLISFVADNFLGWS